MREYFIKYDGFLNNILYDFADDSAIATIDTAIFAMRDDWIERPVPRGNGIVFHTIGGATYLDKNLIYHEYREKYAQKMRINFAGLYADICSWLEKLTNYPTQIADFLCPPGFHIYKGHPLVPPSILTGGNIHLDLPHLNHQFSHEILDTISFTMPIRLPKFGGGCYYWLKYPENFKYGSAVNLSDTDTRTWFDKNKIFYPYEIGKMVLHNGQTYHQLANANQSDFDDWRITLQGHGVLLSDKRIYLYF